MRTSTLLLIATLGTGCTEILGSSTNGVEGADDDAAAGEYDRDDCKIEGEAIGDDGVSVRLGAKTVSFHDWIGKDDSPGEYVGFSLSLSGGTTISYVVKAGGELHPSDETIWIHPNGTSGDQVPGISNVDFCEECEGGGCDGGGGDNDPDPNCDNPDGCDGGGGGDGDDDCDNPDGCDGGGGGGDGDGDGGGGTTLPPASFPNGSDVPELQGLPGCGNPDGCDGSGGGSGPLT
jgi:hypothetical protein